MLTEYIEEALKRARYEIIDDEELYYGEIEELKGVWAIGKTLEECGNNLKEIIEGWIMLRNSDQITFPFRHSGEPRIGVQGRCRNLATQRISWIPAFAGMTRNE